MSHAPAEPSFAIVTPSYNQGAYLAATIQSVLAQDHPRVRYTVMDACSTDGRTAEVLAQYRDDPRVRVVVEPDAGQTDAIAKGFARTPGEILGWLNSDDVLHPGVLRAAAAVFAARPDVGLVYGDADFIDDRGEHIAACAHVEPFDRDRLLNVSDFIVQPAAFFRRAAFDAVGGLDASLNWAMDYDLWLKLTARYPAAYVRQTWASYRWVGRNKTAVGGYARIDEVARVAARHGARTLPAYFRLERANLHLHDAAGHLRAARVLGAAADVARAGAAVLGSGRAVAAALSPRTWRVIRTGHRLRTHAAARHPG